MISLISDTDTDGTGITDLMRELIINMKSGNLFAASRNLSLGALPREQKQVEFRRCWCEP